MSRTVRESLEHARRAGLIVGETATVLPDPPAPPSGCTEAVFSDCLKVLAHSRNWAYVHFRPARVLRGGREVYETPFDGDGRGFPDTVLVRERLIFAELKSDTGRVRPEQLEWIDRLRAAGQECYLWYPSQWAEIVRVLTSEVER